MSRAAAEHDWWARFYAIFLKDCLEWGVEPEGGRQIYRDLARAASQAAREAQEDEDMLVGGVVDKIMARIGNERQSGGNLGRSA